MNRPNRPIGDQIVDTDGVPAPCAGDLARGAPAGSRAWNTAASLLARTSLMPGALVSA